MTLQYCEKYQIPTSEYCVDFLGLAPCEPGICSRRYLLSVAAAASAATAAAATASADGGMASGPLAALLVVPLPINNKLLRFCSSLIKG